jgi:hypothetical protein
MSVSTPILTTSSETWALAMPRLEISKAARPIAPLLIFIIASLIVSTIVDALFDPRDSAVLLRREGLS